MNMSNIVNKNGWVLGLLLSYNLDEILLIKKLRGPVFNIGKWNGVGGKIEDNETPIESIRRETLEETGVDVKDWLEVCCIETANGPVYVFVCNSNSVYDYKQIEDEELKIFKTFTLFTMNRDMFCSNLYWIVPMASNILRGVDQAKRYGVKEIY